MNEWGFISQDIFVGIGKSATINNFKTRPGYMRAERLVHSNPHSSQLGVIWHLYNPALNIQIDKHFQLRILKAKYFPTPLNLTAAYYIYAGFNTYVNMDWENAELGAILPFILFGYAFIAILVDLVMQITFRKLTLFLYLIESLILSLFIIWLVDIGEIQTIVIQGYAQVASIVISLLIIFFAIREAKLKRKKTTKQK